MHLLTLVVLAGRFLCAALHEDAERLRPLLKGVADWRGCHHVTHGLVNRHGHGEMLCGYVVGPGLLARQLCLVGTVGDARSGQDPGDGRLWSQERPLPVFGRGWHHVDCGGRCSDCFDGRRLSSRYSELCLDLSGRSSWATWATWVFALHPTMYEWPSCAQ